MNRVTHCRMAGTGDSLTASDPRYEAKGLMGLIRSGHATVEQIVELIRVTPLQKEYMRDLAIPLMAERAIQLRAAILAEFERLIARQVSAGVRR
jgi:hypothetical protein